MKKTIGHYITIHNKKYAYHITPHDKDTTHVVCEAAHISQDFLNEDIPKLIADLPKLILSEKKYDADRSTFIRFRVSQMDKKKIEQKAVQRGYTSVSHYLRDIALEKVS